jgi:Tol biopolymer transport system component
MNSEQWQRVEDLYHSASALPLEERAQFLRDACGTDQAVHAEVESLIRYQALAEGFIETAALDHAARLLAHDSGTAGASLTGTTVAHFRVCDKIGEGGMGVVYEAEDTRLGRRVALKFLPAALASEPHAVAGLEREARSASALNHPNICTIYSVQFSGGRPFIEMERLEGEPLRDRIARGPFAIDEVMSLTLQIVDGLDAAHAKRIVHRDLTPGNVYCTNRGVAKILDFGIAQLESAPDAGRGVIGTVAYMSPEQASGQAVDTRTDLFSLGALLYEMATGRAAFQGSSSAAVREALLTSEPVPPRRLNPHVPVALERIITKALRKDPAARYQTAEELRADLQRLQRHAARRPYWWTGAVAASGLVAATMGLWYWPVGAVDVFNTSLQLHQVTHNASELGIMSGAISADGRYVAYSDSRGVHIQELATGATARVAPSGDMAAHGNWDVSPGWLPDSSALVANLTTSDDAADSSVWRVQWSMPPQKLRDRAAAAVVSPHGTLIGFSTDGSRSGYRDAWIMAADGGGARKIFDADSDSRIVGLSWSPDAGRIAYLRVANNGAPLSVDSRDLEGGPASTIVRSDEPEVLHGFKWLMDGRLLYSLRRPEAVTSAGALPCSHWQMPVDNAGRTLAGARHIASWLPECVWALSVTADAKQALYLRSAVQDSIHIADVENGGEQVAGLRRLTATDGRHIPSGWASDNRTIVFVADLNGRATVVRQSSESDSPQRLTDEAGIAGAARLTPDGLSVLYLVEPARFNLSGTRHIMRVSVSGGRSEMVVSGKFVDGGARCAVWPAALCAFAERSADNQQLVFTALIPTKGRERELARIDADPSGDYRWALSPDGTRIAVLNTREPKIRILSLSGHSAVTVDLREWDVLGYVSWASDGERLFVPSVGPRGATLFAVDLAGRATRLWHQPGALDISALPSRDGRRLAIWMRRRNANLWLAQSP